MIVALLWGIKQANKAPPMSEEELARFKEKRSNKHGKGNVDSAFFDRIQRLIKHVLPSWNCKESQAIVLLAALLVVRTLLSIWLADVNGRVVKAIVNKDLKLFIKRVSISY